MQREDFHYLNIMKLKRLLLPFILCSTFFMLIFPHASAFGYADRTYEIDLEVYCNPFAGEDICGHPVPTPNFCCFSSPADLENFFDEHLDDTMYMLNEIYRPTGISFRIDQVNLHWNDTIYSTISHDTDVDDPDSIDGEKVKYLKDIAANKPGKITWFMIGSGGIAGFSAIPPYDPLEVSKDEYPSFHYGFFTMFNLDPTLVGHELGHHVCLVHPFTFDDPEQANAEGRSVNHDGDGSAGLVWQVDDTPDDPGPLEIQHPDSEGWDASKNGGMTYEIDHHWCNWWQHFSGLDPNSPFNRYCTMECYRSLSDTTYEIAPYSPDPNIIISYYHWNCSGPYVFSNNGYRVEAFSEDQIDLINTCFDEVTERKLYVDVCEGLGGDSDHDGLCNAYDNCPYTPNYSQFDADNDGSPDQCDNCPYDPNPNQLDTDADTVGDVCDWDDDGDLCADSMDDDPLNNRQVIGTKEYCCASVCSTSEWTGFAGEDTDGDGWKNCMDCDDDDDGICDADLPDNFTGQDCDSCTGEDPCPTFKNDTSCTITALCPPFEIENCFFLCGERFFIKLVSRINPADYIVFDKIALSGNTLYIGMLPGKTLSETSRALMGESFMAAVGAGPLASMQSLQFNGPPLALELWSRSPEQLVKILAEFYPEGVQFGEDIANGKAVAIEVTDRDGLSELHVNATWVFGLDEDDTVSDSDGDGVPDLADNCQDIPNPEQNDRDNDGFGDICDPDFDQNGVVTEEEIDIIRNCTGINLNATEVYGLEKLQGITGQTNPFIMDVIRAYECLKTDLDGDNDIDGDDAALAATLLGERPGPSGIDGKIPQGTDKCSDSNTSPYILIDDCEPSVENELLDDGCTMNDLIAQCGEGAVNHGKFVSCVAHLTNDWKKDGLISGKEKGKIQRCAAQSDIT